MVIPKKVKTNNLISTRMFMLVFQMKEELTFLMLVVKLLLTKIHNLGYIPTKDLEKKTFLNLFGNIMVLIAQQVVTGPVVILGKQTYQKIPILQVSMLHPHYSLYGTKK